MSGMSILLVTGCPKVGGSHTTRQSSQRKTQEGVVLASARTMGWVSQLLDELLRNHILDFRKIIFLIVFASSMQ